jgi:hypothetical protein
LRGRDTGDLAVKTRKTLQNFREEASEGRVAANRRRRRSCAMNSRGNLLLFILKRVVEIACIKTDQWL